MWELLGLLGILFLIGIPVLSIVAFVRTSGLQKRQDALERKMASTLHDLEKALEKLESSGTSSSTVAAEKTPQDSVSEDIEEPEEAPPSAMDDAEDETGVEDAADALDEVDPDQSSEDEPETGESEELPQAARAGPWDIARAKTQSSPDVESMVGGRWSVLLGGLTLALGVVFLVKYSIEEGLLGPGPRVLLGAGFSGLLFAAGEWLRRSDRDFELPVYAKADVPGILTGAGAIGAFASAYAAHALYGFIGPGTAFVLLTVIGIGTMLLSAVHGPKLAAIGVLGAYATPLLVSSSEPNAIALAIHVLVVTAVVMAIAHLRDWRWLAIAGMIASTIWTVLAGLGGGGSAGIAGIMMLAGLAVIFAAMFYLRESAEIKDRKTEWVGVVGFGLLAFAFMAQLATNSDLPDTVTALFVTLIIITLASLRSSLAPTAICASIIALLTILASDLPLEIIEGLVQTSDFSQGLVPRDTNGFVLNALLVSVPVALVGLWGVRRTAQNAPRTSGWLGSAVNGLAFFALLSAYMRLAPFETKPLIGLISLGVAGLLAIATEYFIRLVPEDSKHPAPAAFAVGAIATACFAISVSLDTGWMPLAFGLTALGITLVYWKRPVSTLPWLALAAGGICGFTLYANMPLEMPHVSSTLVFNGLLLLLAVPALALIASGEILRRSQWQPHRFTHVGLTAGGLAVAGLFTGLEISHIINNGNLVAAHQSLAETSGHVLAAMGFAIGLQRIASRTEVKLYDYASMVAGIISVVAACIGLLLVFNPGLDNASVGDGLILNLLLPGYLLTGLAAAAVALLARPVRPRWYTLMYAALSGLLLFSYFSFMLRKAFQGEYLGLYRQTSDLEFWLYSPLWLVMGAVLLGIGLKLKSLPIRMASGLLIALTIVKVFLLDMSELTGILRALSFIGLGLSLIVIGRFYQRILTRQARQEKADNAGDSD
ncbi:MAG: DUF2339 domain-containing protein [Pseudomonadota bacterium]